MTRDVQVDDFTTDEGIDVLLQDRDRQLKFEMYEDDDGDIFCTVTNMENNQTIADCAMSIPEEYVDR